MPRSSLKKPNVASDKHKMGRSSTMFQNIEKFKLPLRHVTNDKMSDVISESDFMNSNSSRYKIGDSQKNSLIKGVTPKAVTEEDDHEEDDIEEIPKELNYEHSKKLVVNQV